MGVAVGTGFELLRIFRSNAENALTIGPGLVPTCCGRGGVVLD